MKRQNQLFQSKISGRTVGTFLFTRTSDIVLRMLSKGCKPPPGAIEKSGEKYLIVNGDDLCKDEHTDEAIITAYRKGILTSTSAFINFPGSVEKLIKHHQHCPELPIGLHLNITNGQPVLEPKKVKSLTDNNGHFHTIDEFLNHLPNMPVEKVRDELDAQIQLFLSTGVPLDHIDYHFHILPSYPPFFKIVRELALRYKLPVRNPVPFSIYRLIKLQKKGEGTQTGIQKLILFGITHPFKSIPILRKVGPVGFTQQARLMNAEGIASTDWFIDSFFNNATPEIFISILEQLPAGISEIVCHPGKENELDVLTSSAVKDAISKLDIRLIKYDHIKELKKKEINTIISINEKWRN